MLKFFKRISALEKRVEELENINVLKEAIIKSLQIDIDSLKLVPKKEDKRVCTLGVPKDQLKAINKKMSGEGSK